MLYSLAGNWLHLATTHGSTKWVQRFICSYLPQLHDQTITPEAIAQLLVEEFDSRGLKTLSQQKNYRSNLVQALKVLDAQHPAIALVSPSAKEYRELNDAQRGKLAKRETQYFTSRQAEELVKQATLLLDSSEWSDVGAGLAVLIGRRISEILLSEFSLKSPWSLYFTGMAKKGEENSDRLTLEIPTLTLAETVLKAIQKLQQSLKIEELKLNSLSPKMARQKVNQRFSGAIAIKCNQHFGNLIPARSDKDNLYTHIFRAVYTTIATYWFCPPNIPKHSFKAEIQGHFTIAADGRKLPNFSARANYDDYAIGDGQGNRDGRVGIKLGTLPGLQVIKAFRKLQALEINPPPLIESSISSEAEDPADDNMSNQAEAQAGDRSLLTVEIESAGMATKEKNFAENFATPVAAGDRSPLSSLSELTPTILDKPTANTIRFRAAGLLAKANPSSAELLVALQILTGLSNTQLTEAKVTAISSFQISVNGVQVTTLVQHLEPYIERFRRSPYPSAQNIQQVCENTFHDLPVHHHSLCQLYSLIKNQPIRDAVPMSTSKPKVRRPELHAHDLEHMHALMAKSGIGGNSADVFHALLEAFEVTQSRQQQQHNQTLGEVAQTLNWFTCEIEQLRAQLKTLEQERDQLKGNLSTTEELHRLQIENQQLKNELKQTQSRLEGIQDLLGLGSQRQPQEHQKVISSSTTKSTSADDSHSPVQESLRPAAAIPRRKREDTTAKIHQIIDAIIAWNTSQDDSARQLRISIPIIKDLASPIGANYQPVIQQVIKLREQELENHHSQLMLGIRHNASVIHKNQILHAIAQHYLSLNI